MSLDSRYRPKTYSDVVGQGAIVDVLRPIVAAGHGFHQSYVFFGNRGSGKTTLARILARALLCHSPAGGDPCDSCPSCLSMLSGSSPDYCEVDAASHSGKDFMKKVVEETGYSSFSGRRKVYVFDEAHNITKDGFDALLIPMEAPDSPGSEDRRLVAIFCTTELHKMKPTILSRCASSLRIRTAEPSAVADRLSAVCAAEGIEFEREALVYIAEFCQSRFRDSLIALESVSVSGPVTGSSVSSHLGLSHVSLLARLLESAVSDNREDVVKAWEELSQLEAPQSMYEKAAELLVLAWRAGNGGSPQVPSWIGKASVQSISKGGDRLLRLSSALSSRPTRVSSDMFLCDILAWMVGPQRVETHTASKPSSLQTPKDGTVRDKPVLVDGVYVPPRSSPPAPEKKPQASVQAALSAGEFFRLSLMGSDEIRRGKVGSP